MKIAGIIFESLLKAGGYEIFTYNLFKTLAQRGNDVTVYVPPRRLRKERGFLSALPFHVRSLPRQTSLLLNQAPKLLGWLMRREQARRGHDVWQVMGAHPEATAVRGLAGVVPLCLRTHGDDVQFAPQYGYGMRKDPGVDATIRANLKLMDRVVALTPGIVDDLAELGTRRDRIRVIPNGISLAQYEKPRDREAVRKRCGVTPDQFFILTVGRNHPKKGFDLIPSIAGALKEQGKNFSWLVVGGETEKLRPEIRRRGLEGVVRPLPGILPPASAGAAQELPPDELVDLYCAADVFFFPSRLETFGRVILEAMAARTPVITTNALGCRDVAGMGKHARMVPVDDVKAMVGALVSFMDDPELRARFAVAGRRQAEGHDWQAIAKAYEQVFEELREIGPRPPEEKR
ncbi:glycosyltransferase family 4 protein [Paucidesulfovibrio longus]|uniref:glycosyltransferase family 4 protein n=1 Tax=Paucidesulfovibrio longus TaxID=889 RepID=UPI0003B41B68|nr:glycosyltransferase family 4 protein [Paucidesulfovibrio longus]